MTKKEINEYVNKLLAQHPNDVFIEVFEQLVEMQRDMLEMAKHMAYEHSDNIVDRMNDRANANEVLLRKIHKLEPRGVGMFFRSPDLRKRCVKEDCYYNYEPVLLKDEKKDD